MISNSVGKVGETGAGLPKVGQKLEDFEIAIHEAGHSIAARVLGIPFAKVSIRPHSNELIPTVPVRWAKRWEWVVLWCAGSAANVMFNGYEWTEVWRTRGEFDLAYLWYYFRPYASDDDDFWRIIRIGEKQAMELLREHERDVKTVAKHLLESRSLSRDLINSRLKDAHWLERFEVLQRRACRPHLLRVGNPGRNSSFRSGDRGWQTVSPERFGQQSCTSSTYKKAGACAPA